MNFWATWCEPCVTEMPSLQRVRDQFAPRFEVLGVNYQEGPARIKAFIDRSGITFPIVRDTDGAVAKAWGARIFPASYLVDEAGAREARADRRRRLDKSDAPQHNPRVAVGAPSGARRATHRWRVPPHPSRRTQ